MSNIINLFSKTPVESKTLVEPETNTYTFDPVRAWEQFEKSHTGIPTIANVLEHEVTMPEIGMGITLATVLMKDAFAILFFLDTMKLMAETCLYTVPLSDIPPRCRGYVWSYDYQGIAKPVNYILYNFPEIIKKEVKRCGMF